MMALGISVTPQTTAGGPPTRIVLLLVDDLGWMDLGCQGNDFVDTPAIDRLAAEGMRFTDAYASGAVCSPTRCAIQSGQNQARIGITDFIPGHWRPFERVTTPRPRNALPLEAVTVAETLQRAGVTTGYLGKWHLGSAQQMGPAQQGYDLGVVIEGPHLPGRFRAVTGRKDFPQPKPGQFRTEYEAERASAFLREHRDEPFFLMVSPFAVHIPLAARSDLVAKYTTRAEERGASLPHPVYAALIEQTDDLVGVVVDTLDELGLTETTMLVVTSDNGGLHKRYDYRAAADDLVSTQAPLRGEKGTLYEGGIRVPWIVRYPVKSGSIGRTCSIPVVSHDLYPTFAAMAGAPLPTDQVLDGVDLLPLLDDPEAALPRTAIHWHYPHYHHDRPASALREGPFKLIEFLDGSGDVELYDLASDLGETRNLAAELPERSARMRRDLAAWRQEVTAAMPHPNPSFDPDRAAEWWSIGNGQPVQSDARRRFPPTEKH